MDMNLAWNKSRVLRMIGSLDYYQRNFHNVHMFTDIFKKRELRENMYSAKMSTFRVFHLSVHVIIHNIIVSLSYGPVPNARNMYSAKMFLLDVI